MRVQMVERTVNWTGVAFPNEGWAEKVFGEPDVERLWDAVAVLHEARRRRPGRRLARAHGAARVARREADRAEVRLAPLHAARARTSRSACSTARAGCRRSSTRPRASSTSRTCRPRRSSRRPTPRRAEGTIRSTQPLALLGDVVEGLELTVKDGKIVDVRGGQWRRPRARPARERRARRVLRRARPRRRRPRASARRASRSSTRSSTRTRPATSPTASASRRSSKASPTRE